MSMQEMIVIKLKTVLERLEYHQDGRQTPVTRERELEAARLVTQTLGDLQKLGWF